jgi:D-apiose dehydrogenase
MTDTSKGPVKLGLIGCGFFAQNHLHAWKDIAAEGVEIAAVCDVDPTKAKAAADQFGAPRWYTDADAMFRDEKLGLVDIATRMDTHQSLVERAIRHRIPAIVQKPFGPDYASCQAMTTAASKAGVFLAIHENFRFQKPLRMAKEILASGEIGEPNWARVSFRTGYDIYKGQPYLAHDKRFVIVDLGTHVFDLARYFLGEAEYLMAETQRRDPKVKGEDTATALLKHRSGGVSIVECTYASKRIPDCFPETLVELEGSKGVILLKPGPILELSVNGKMTAIDVDPPVPSWGERPWHVIQESVVETCRHLLAALRAGRAADTSAQDNLKTFELCEAAYTSAGSGKRIAIS